MESKATGDVRLDEHLYDKRSMSPADEPIPAMVRGIVLQDPGCAQHTFQETLGHSVGMKIIVAKTEMITDLKTQVTCSI